jgi:outer membrane immunogenic protein
MKPIVVAAMLGLVGAVQALGAELPSPEPLPPASYFPAAEYNWSGPYFGINGGYGFGTSSWNLGALSTGNFNVDGLLLGGTLGANFFQINGFVFGGEGDIDWSRLGGSSSAAGCANIGAPAGTSCQTGSHWISTGRARVGYALGRVLLYATGGLVVGDIDVTSQSGTFTGGTGGGGIEVAFTDHLTAKAEYFYVNFPNVHCSSATSAPVICATGGIGLTENIVRGGINYKFSW